MAIIDQTLKLEISEQLGVVKNEKSVYDPGEDERAIRQMVIRHFQYGYTTMYKPRVEFNDLSTLGRDQVDFLAWNTYQPNNGDAYPGDQVNGWRSNAIRPIERNKAISVAAHATAKLLYPKIFAFDQQSQSQEDAARVISDLMQWTAERYDYAYTALKAVIQALVAPAAIVYSEYAETYREVKRERNADGTWKKSKELDETMSGFRDHIVPVDELYIENFFEPDIQKQGWLIWRRVQDHQIMKEKYGHLPNFQHVKPGMQCFFNDANQGFYYVYDPELRNLMDEEVLYFNRSMDLMLAMVNGVLVTSHDNPNPRNDKLYPFSKFGYELINARCFYYKSLVFKVSHDANIINTIYPMVIDGTYLNIMPPFFSLGGEIIGSDVIVPGQVTTLSDPNSQLQPIKVATDIKSGMEAMFKVEESINQTSEIPISPERGGDQTAYETAKREQERNTVLGLFIQMIANFIKQFGVIRLGDILQYMTIAQADKITDDAELVYRTFLVSVKDHGAKHSKRRIKFDNSLSSSDLSPQQKLMESFKTLKEQGGLETDTELCRVNPELIRNLQYMVVSSPDVLNPRSEDVERMYGLEIYDRAIQNPTVDQEEVTRDFLFGGYAKSAKNPDKYLKKQTPGGNMLGADQMPQIQGQQQQPNPAMAGGGMIPPMR